MLTICTFCQQLHFRTWFQEKSEKKKTNRFEVQSGSTRLIFNYFKRILQNIKKKTFYSFAKKNRYYLLWF
jgi:hypothetical protein